MAEVQNLRVALASAIEENIELVAEADSSLVVRTVQDVDIEGVIVSQPKTAGDEEVEVTELAATTALHDATMAGVALAASALVLTVTCAPHRVTRLLPRLRKPG